MSARERTAAVLAVVLGGAGAVVASTQPWLAVTLRAGASESIDVAGASAFPLLAPLGLAALALGLALSVVGRVLRYVFGVLAGAIGAAVVIGAARIGIGQPLDAVAQSVTTATGLSGTDAISDLVSEIAGTAWPFVATIGGVAVAAGGILTLATAHRWRTGGRRYQRDASRTPATAAGPRPDDASRDKAIDSWDDLSHGEDPTAR
ncbi:MAG: Trp biosynthesis-associated membrane protein [Microbacterium sp.]